MHPIGSRRELEAARQAVKELRGELSRMGKLYHHDRETYRRTTEGIRLVLRELVGDIRRWESMSAGRPPAEVEARDPETGQLELPRTLKMLRRVERIDQVELARRLGTRQGNVSRWEREGYDALRVKQLVRIADALGYDVEMRLVRRERPRGEEREG